MEGTEVVNRPKEENCPVCGYPFAIPFFDGGSEPLATLGWPSSREEAVNMTRYRNNFVMCPNCTHVWNCEFKYEHIPYKSNPNRMFNSGKIWNRHIEEVIDTICETVPENPKVVEVGCGEGHFLRILSDKKRGNYIGFDPNAEAKTEGCFEFIARYYEPFEDTLKLRPDMIVMRHVLEHLSVPSHFIGQTAWAAKTACKEVRMLIESPCIDRVFSSGRLSDFFYEHPHQFSTESFRVLLERFGSVEVLRRSYNDEVVYGVVRLGVRDTLIERAEIGWNFYRQVAITKEAIKRQLKELAESAKRVVIWGGTGKSAAFMNHYVVDGERFPLVVDSDPEKVGTFVPGTGQKIQSSDLLIDEPPDVVIIPTQWRVREILLEMERKGIKSKKILIEHNGRLIDFDEEPHPY